MSNCMPVHIALLFLFALIACFSSYDSTIGPNTMPREMHSMAIGYDSINDTILLFGGSPFSQQFTMFKDNQFTDRGEEYLSSSQSTWSYSQHYTTLDDRLWIINENGKNLLWIDLQTYSVTSASFTLPIDVNGYGCLTSHQTYLIVLGGGYPNALNTVQIYDLSNNQWLSDIPTLLTKRRTFACLTVNNNTYAIGGYTGSNYLSSIEVLDVSNIAQINTEQWQYLSGALYQPSVTMRAVQYGDYIIIIGGRILMYNTVNTQRAVFSTDINLIDTATGNCDKVGDLAFGTAYAASIIVHNILYIFGGWTASGTHNVDDRYQIIYLPPLADTSKAPTLSLTVKPTQYYSTSSFDATYYAIAGSNTIFDSSDRTIGIISTKTIVIILAVILLSVIAVFGYRYWNNNHRYKETRKNMQMDEPGDIKQMDPNVDGEESIEVRASVVEEGHVAIDPKHNEEPVEDAVAITKGRMMDVNNAENMKWFSIAKEAMNDAPGHQEIKESVDLDEIYVKDVGEESEGDVTVEAPKEQQTKGNMYYDAYIDEIWKRENNINADIKLNVFKKKLLSRIHKNP